LGCKVCSDARRETGGLFLTREADSKDRLRE
jgi:hypothetical protein